MDGFKLPGQPGQVPKNTLLIGWHCLQLQKHKFGTFKALFIPSGEIIMLYKGCRTAVPEVCCLASPT